MTDGDNFILCKNDIIITKSCRICL